STQQAPQPGKRMFLLLGLAVIVVILVPAILAWYEVFGQWSEENDDDYVNGNVVEITQFVNGTVINIGAEDVYMVHEGQVFLKYDQS
ncbi:EmrA/EmrK family multidrug efflux transporter periplasmic adaptor subunit, partial [Pseudomonas syringae pv. tagetis]